MISLVKTCIENLSALRVLSNQSGKKSEKIKQQTSKKNFSFAYAFAWCAEIMDTNFEQCVPLEKTSLNQDNTENSSDMNFCLKTRVSTVVELWFSW